MVTSARAASRSVGGGWRSECASCAAGKAQSKQTLAKRGEAASERWWERAWWKGAAARLW